MLFRSTLNAALLALSIPMIIAKSHHCPPHGPVLPTPANLSSNPNVSLTALTLRLALDSLFSQASNSTAISLSVKSIHDEDPILDVHVTPDALDERGAQNVTGDTVYRIASVSKVFTVLAALKTAGMGLDDPVTKFLPRLRDLKRQQEEENNVTTVDWDSITIKALASSMGGVPADLTTDLTSFPGDWTQLGLPEANETLGCIGLYGIRGCNSTDFWENMGKRPPVYAPWSSPVYSNAAFMVLGLAIENATGTDFETFVNESIFQSSGMENTTYTKPDDSLGAISVGDWYWNASMGVWDPAGGFYSTSNDLINFGSSILNNTFLPSNATNAWLQPISFTSSAGTFLGAPWEIYRSNNVTSDHRYVEFYTKAGGLGTYHSLLALVPDYDLVFTFLSAGPEASAAIPQVVFSQVMQALLPAIEEAGKQAANETYVGEYHDEETNSTAVLVLEDNAPGLRVVNLTVRGVEVLENYPTNIAATNELDVQAAAANINLTASLFPTSLTADDGNKVSWRAVIEETAPEVVEMAESLFVWPDAVCQTWASLDRAANEFKSLDHVIFELEKGEVTSVELVGFQVTLKKVD